MYFPPGVWEHLISYLPVKKRFTFDKNKNCELHWSIMFKTSYMKTKHLIDDYLLTNNNFLSNIHNNTPLHVACQHDQMQSYRYLKRKCPQMAKIRNIHNKLPIYCKHQSVTWIHTSDSESNSDSNSDSD